MFGTEIIGGRSSALSPSKHHVDGGKSGMESWLHPLTVQEYQGDEDPMLIVLTWVKAIYQHHTQRTTYNPPDIL